MLNNSKDNVIKNVLLFIPMSKNYYRKEIDGLRAVAILPVVLYHTYSFSFAKGGFLGVDIFFVISGFLITNILLDEISLTNKISLINFYNRRVRRIIPALFFVTLMCIYPAYKLLFPITFKEFGQSLMGVSTLIPNLIFLIQGGYFGEPESLKPLLHTWSLGVEEQFYFFFPLFLIIFWKVLKRKILVVISILFFFSLILADDLSNGSYFRENFFLPFTRMWEFLAGAFISYYNFFLKKKNFELFEKNLLSVLGVFLLIYSFLILDKYSHPSFLTAIPVLGTCLIILFGTGETFIGKFLSWKYIVGIGLISYSLYLWHVPIFVFARHYNFMSNLEGNNYYLSSTKYFFLIAITFAMSYFSWKYIEQPFRQRKIFKDNLKKKKISDRNLIKLCIISFLIIFFSGYLINKNDGYIERFPQEVSNYLNYEYSYASDEIINPCRESLSKIIKRKIVNEKYKQKKIFDECRILGDKKYEPKTILIGDSLTHSLVPLFNNHFSNKKSSFYYYIEDCFTSEGFMIEGYCFNDFQSILNNSNVENIIIFFRWSVKLSSLNKFEKIYYCGINLCYDQKNIDLFKKREKKLQESFRKKIDLLLDKNKKITIIYPLPYIGIDPPKYLASMVLNKKVPLASVDYNETIYRNSSTKKFLDSFKGNVLRIYPDKIFCNTFIKDKCAINLKEKVFFSDSTHLSLEGADLLGNEILEKTNLFNMK